MNVRAFRFKLLYSIFFLFFGGIVLFFLNTFLFVRKGVPASYKQSLFRRNKIDWPSDCEYSTRSKDLVAEKIKLPAEVCTDAIDSLQSELPKDCEYNNVALGEDGKIDLYRYRDFLGRAPIRFFSLGKGEFLGELLCDATAYNENRIYFLYDERTIPAKTKLLKFIAYEFSWNRNDEASEKIRMKRLESDRWIRYYKPETKEWIAFFKFRGMGDCGTYFRYQPSEQNLPVLVEIRAKLECDGTEAYSADEVPITWKQYEVPFDWKEWISNVNLTSFACNGRQKAFEMLKSVLQKYCIKMGRDKVFRLLKKNHLLLEKQRKYARTTNSNRPFFKYPNLINNLIPAEANLIFVSGITYIKIKDGLAYLSLITDLYSRKIVGFKLHHSLETEGCIHALNMALAQIPKGKKIFRSRYSILFEGLYRYSNQRRPQNQHDRRESLL